MSGFKLSPDQETELKAKLETAKVEQAQLSQPVNQQVHWGEVQVFFVAADSDIGELMDRFETNGPSDTPIGPCHAIKNEKLDV